MKVFELINILEEYDENCDVVIDKDGQYFDVSDIRSEVLEPLSMFDKPEEIIILDYDR